MRVIKVRTRNIAPLHSAHCVGRHFLNYRIPLILHLIILSFDPEHRHIFIDIQ